MKNLPLFILFGGIILAIGVLKHTVKVARPPATTNSPNLEELASRITAANAAANDPFPQFPTLRYFGTSVARDSSGNPTWTNQVFGIIKNNNPVPLLQLMK